MALIKYLLNILVILSYLSEYKAFHITLRILAMLEAKSLNMQSIKNVRTHF